MTERVDWDYQFKCNQPAIGWRQKLASMFRDLADDMDQRATLVLDITTEPELPLLLRNTCIKRGLDKMEADIEVAVEGLAMDMAFDLSYPDLKEEVHVDGN